MVISFESVTIREEIEETETMRLTVKGTKLFKATFPKMRFVHRMPACNGNERVP